MISTLHIKNIGIIDDLSIDLNEGLNVLTGETGAGKTLIIDSLGIISGGRFSKEMIRKSETNSFVEICMYEPENENSIDGNIIVSREINSNGKNMCKINGRMVTVNELKNFMSRFIEIHGQNDNQSLLDNKFHLKYLDGFIGDKIIDTKKQYKEKYEKYLEIKQELKNNYGDEKERERKLDLLRYQFNEIEEANLKVNEEDNLEEKRKLMLNSEKISKNLNEADIAIGENSIDSINTAIRALEKIENIDKKYEDISSNLKNIYYELQEISRDISEHKEDVYFDEQERNEVEERLDLIYNLKRKYGNDVQEILNYKDEIEAEINHIENLDEYNNKLKKELKQLKQEMTTLAEKMHKLRNEYGKVLSININKVLEDLEMKNANINIHVDYNEEEYFENGKDIVEFYITTNLGEDEKQLAKIASGGEMSRIMLAIKKVLADTDKMPVLIFDEIDTGISGKAAGAVAEKLNGISKNHQVLCISHLPSIAAIADYNYFISKRVINERTNTNIKLLNEKETLEEIARISSGEINEATIQYAMQLRNKKVS
ncbi:dNA replication and repair protein RecN [Clostridium sp. CAG:470]|nr:MAG: DNA repair protein RecN [Clostridium sp. 28_17]CDE13905.1 dNA replication and repair protein RecN [Clostridium sp. CAG:470]